MLRDFSHSSLQWTISALLSSKKKKKKPELSLHYSSSVSLFGITAITTARGQRWIRSLPSSWVLAKIKFMVCCMDLREGRSWFSVILPSGTWRYLWNSSKWIHSSSQKRFFKSLISLLSWLHCVFFQYKKVGTFFWVKMNVIFVVRPILC